MRHIIYLKNLENVFKEKGRETVCISKFRLCFSKPFKDLEKVYGEKARKFLKKRFFYDLNESGEFVITKTVRCHKDDIYDFKKGKALSKLKVAEKACNVLSGVIQEIVSCMEKDRQGLMNQLSAVEDHKSKESLEFTCTSI